MENKINYRNISFNFFLISSELKPCTYFQSRKRTINWLGAGGCIAVLRKLSVSIYSVFIENYISLLTEKDKTPL